jgi:hypothetical protein
MRTYSDKAEFEHTMSNNEIIDHKYNTQSNTNSLPQQNHIGKAEDSFFCQKEDKKINKRSERFRQGHY